MDNLPSSEQGIILVLLLAEQEKVIGNMRESFYRESEMNKFIDRLESLPSLKSRKIPRFGKRPVWVL